MTFLAILTAAVNVAVAAPHAVKANAKWPVTIRVTNAAGTPLRATLTMRITFSGMVVGKVDDGKVWRFVGTWREPKGQEITWPAAARGQTFGFLAIVRAAGRTVKKTFLVRVR